MQMLPTGPRSVIAMACIVCIGAAGLAYRSWPKKAKPGRLPAVAPADREAAMMPTDGVVIPNLGAADQEKLKNGEAVEIRVGGGMIKMEPMKKGEQQ